MEMKATRFVFVVVLVLLLVPLTYGVSQELSRSRAGGVENDDMNDRAAVETFTPAARGRVKTVRVQTGEISILKVSAQNLPVGREFEVVVTVGPEGETDFIPVVIVEGDPIEIGRNRRLTVENIAVGSFDPGVYRVDILVFPAGDGFPRDFILA
ncbi:MAG: hypothetical protein O7D32_04555, partial [bacterium]|nr:hypothetical protein [bacterium]